MRSIVLRIVIAFFAFTLVWAAFALLYVAFLLLARSVDSYNV
jgi:hypothetical protein